MEVDFTQWWVPAATMVVLGAYVFMSGLREYRLPALVVAAPAETEEVAAEVTAKRGFLARTSWIWGSVLVGAGAQAYLSYIAV